MRTPLVLPKGPAVAVLEPPGAQRLASSVARLLPSASLAAILAMALFLRLFRLNGFITFYPDTYGQMRAADNLVLGHIPITYLYPPGVALILAPFFALFPRDLTTLQTVIMAAGLALVGLAYCATAAATGDRRAALIHAFAVAMGATFVFHSRAALFDVINTLLVAASLLLAPSVAQRRSMLVLAGYGLLVFITITTRYTNPVILPALALAAVGAGADRVSWRLALHRFRSRQAVTVGAVVTGLYALYVATSAGGLTRFANSRSGSVVDLHGYLPRIGQYVQASLIGYGEHLQWASIVIGLTVVPFAVCGARRLWRTNRRLAVPLSCLLLTWPLAHALYVDFWGRYAMPMYYFVLMLAALGVSRALAALPSLPRPGQRLALAGLLATTAAFFLVQQGAIDIAIFSWNDRPAQIGEQTYEGIRSELRTVDGQGAVLISAQIMAVDRANSAMAPYDLLRHSETYGINEDSIRRLIAYVRAQQQAGATVYYHYTGYEQKRSDLDKYELSFYEYYHGLSQAFELRLIGTSGPAQRLYQVLPRPEPAASRAKADHPR